MLIAQPRKSLLLLMLAAQPQIAYPPTHGRCPVIPRSLRKPLPLTCGKCLPIPRRCPPDPGEAAIISLPEPGEVVIIPPPDQGEVRWGSLAATAPDAPSAVPQSAQNFAPAALSALQFGQRFAKGLPHSAQNFLPGIASVPHFVQRIVVLELPSLLLRSISPVSATGLAGYARRNPPTGLHVPAFCRNRRNSIK